MASAVRAATISPMTALDSISTKHERPKFDELQVADMMHAGVLTCLMDAPLDVIVPLRGLDGIGIVPGRGSGKYRADSAALGGEGLRENRSKFVESQRRGRARLVLSS